ncbi:MAG: ParB/RepB/Spo0J family partition protein, partial [Oliverpabstia sp.]|nr:ParB/RepB/Spo0J family partition protein [Oliverpabstia sp.]
MKSRSASKIKLTSYDDLIGGAVSKDDIQEIPIGQLRDFVNHPFHVNDDDEMNELVESIKTQGVLTALLVRPSKKGGYEIVSGHRRKHAAVLAGLTQVPVIIREMSDDAVRAMVDSNLQREHILPSEKAFAYKMKMQAMNHQGVSGGISAETIGKAGKDSARQVYRYVRLTYLRKPILDAVDKDLMGIQTGVELSYLEPSEQIWLEEIHNTTGKYPSLEQAKKIKIRSEEKTLTKEILRLLIMGEKRRARTVTLKQNEINKYFTPDYDEQKMRTVIIELLEESPEEQEILSNYVGWGGLPDAFDESKASWSEEYQELKDLLTKEEYAAARESTLNAHYTQPVIIESMYQVLQNLGFEKGNILEPSMGVGNFFGMLPDKLQQSRLYGVELDSISGRIAKLLYPNADIQIKGFEKTDYPNDFFDVAIGNVPFGSYKVNDRQYDKHNFMIHDYFLAKTIDQLRPGGVAALITTKGTMDKASPEVRKYLVERAELLGAIRLPNNAFKANAGTEVSADILFFQKRESITMEEPEWVALGEDKNGITINQYFITHPEMVLGTMAEVSGPYGMETACLPLEGADLAEQLEDAVAKIHGTMVPAVTAETELDEIMESIPADPSVRNYSFTVVDDQIYYRINSLMNPVKLPAATAERVKGMVEIREVVRELIALQMEENATDEAIRELQVKLNQVYDSYTEKYGVIGSNANKRAFSDDSSYCLLCSLEDLNEDGTLKRKADMFTKRTIKKAVAVTSVETAAEALTISLNEKARVDLPYMAGLTGKTEEKVAEELTGVIFRDPVNGQWETADEYLSGNVREKLKTARIFAVNHPEFTSNVNALKQVQPVDLDASEIEVRIGATWIAPEIYRDFMEELFDTPGYLVGRVIDIRYSEASGAWNISGKNADSDRNV